MGTVPTPARPLDGVVMSQANTTDSWYNTHQFLLQPPSCRVALTTDVSYAVNTTTNVAWNAESWDIFQTGDTEMHSTSVNPERITIRTAGRYHVQWNIYTYTPGAAGAVNLNLLKNGTAVIQTGNNFAANTSVMFSLSDEIQLAVGDYLTVQINPVGSGVQILGTRACSMAVTWRSI